jgi:SAM-dependent methyltransferase
MPCASADLILALDVLEHVADLPATVAQLCRVLVPGGRLVVSGPTENLLYRCGRRLAGFSGSYHRRSVYAVLEAIRPHLQIRRRVTLLRACPLFILASCTKPPEALPEGTLPPPPGKPA